MEKLNVVDLNEVFEQAVFVKNGTTFEVLQVMEDVNVDDFIGEVDTIGELKASIPVIGQYQYIKVTFSKDLKDAILGWDSDATDVVEPEDWVKFVPATQEQFDQLTVEQLYNLVSTYIVDMYSYTSFESPNILEDFVTIQEG